MEKLPKPRNQHAQAVLLLIENGSRGVTMKTAMQDFFHKFNTRLGEVEKAHPKIKIRRLPINSKNRFGHPVRYLNYKSVAHYKYLVNLYKKLNAEK